MTSERTKDEDWMKNEEGWRCASVKSEDKCGAMDLVLVVVGLSPIEGCAPDPWQNSWQERLTPFGSEAGLHMLLHGVKYAIEAAGG